MFKEERDLKRVLRVKLRRTSVPAIEPNYLHH